MTVDLLADQIIDGRYRLVRLLAEGGMGAVYEAEHLGLHKAVALKLMHRQIADVPGVAARFEREARTTSQLDDPHIVRVSDFGRAPSGELYLVMELLVGQSLAGLLTSEGALPSERAVGITDQILAGLVVAHAHGLVHRDLKPDNIFLRSNATGADQVKLLDFGIASVRGDQRDTKLTQTGAVLGTPAYMAPEQAMGMSDIDARTDLHAVGVMLYEMLTGTRPYDGENYHQVLHAIISATPTPLTTLRPGLNASVVAVVQRAMATAQADRFPDALAFRAALSGDTRTPSIARAAEPAFALPAQLATTDLKGTPVSPPSSELPSLPPQYFRVEESPPPTPPIALPSLPPQHFVMEESPPPTPARATRTSQPRQLRVDDDAPALELDRPPPRVDAPAEPSRSRGKPWWIVVLALVVVGGFAARRVLFAPHDAIIELTHVPIGARLSLDGTPIEGTRLQLPISKEVHSLLMIVTHRPPRSFRFDATHDQQINLGGP